MALKWIAPKPDGGKRIADGGVGTFTNPWLRFNEALTVANFNPGDTLMLKDGTYERTGSAADTGYPVMVGDAGLDDNVPPPSVKDGIPGLPIVMLAENERKALMKGDGNDRLFHVRNLAHWEFRGIRTQNADNVVGATNRNSLFFKCKNIYFWRWLCQFNNRYFNSSLLEYSNGEGALAEECEFYDFHRHSLSFFRSTGCTNRRCYANSRFRADLPDGYPSAPMNSGIQGQAVTVSYGSDFTTIDNAVSENNRSGLSNPAGQEGGRYSGCISINDVFGVSIDTRGNTVNGMIRDLIVKDFLAMIPDQNGLRAETSKTIFDGITIDGGVVALEIKDGLDEGDGLETYLAQNINAFGASLYTFRITPALSFQDWKVDFINSDKSGQDYMPASDANGSVTNSTTLPHGMGESRVFIPDDAVNLKGKGKAGADLGANILYRYHDGVLSTEKLWDVATGQWLAMGVIIAGVNDVVGQSLFDMHLRVGLADIPNNPWPASYAEEVEPPPPVANTPINVLEASPKTVVPDVEIAVSASATDLDGDIISSDIVGDKVRMKCDAVAGVVLTAS